MRLVPRHPRPDPPNLRLVDAKLDLTPVERLEQQAQHYRHRAGEPGISPEEALQWMAIAVALREVAEALR